MNILEVFWGSKKKYHCNKKHHFLISFVEPNNVFRSVTICSKNQHLKTETINKCVAQKSKDFVLISVSYLGYYEHEQHAYYNELIDNNDLFRKHKTYDKWYSKTVTTYKPEE